MEHIHLVDIFYDYFISKRMCAIYCQICHHSWRRLWRWVTEVPRRIVRKAWRKYAQELWNKKMIMSLARKEKQCSVVPDGSRGRKDEIACGAIWVPVNGMNFESLNYLRLKWNPNILPPWANEWVGGWVSDCVCVCVCVFKMEFQSKTYFCYYLCWRRVCVSSMGSKSAKFLPLKLTSKTITCDVFSKITESNLTPKKDFRWTFLHVSTMKAGSYCHKDENREPKFHEPVLIKQKLQAQPWRYKYFCWIREEISADL